MTLLTGALAAAAISTIYVTCPPLASGSRVQASGRSVPRPLLRSVHAVLGQFKTPTHNIVCQYRYNVQDAPPSVFCGIQSGLKPPPPHVDCHGNGDYTDRLALMNATGRVQVPSCWGDPGPFAVERHARVLRYGKSWHHRGLRCASAFKGLTCRNKSGHGFFLSREHSRSF